MADERYERVPVLPSDEPSEASLPRPPPDPALDPLRDRLRAQLFGATDATDGAGNGGAPRIGRFVILRPLGAGGMGHVYVAYDEQLERKVAIKVLRSDLAPEPRHQQRLLREAQALARLSDPHVVTVYEAGQEDGQVFLAMELVPGQSLRRWQQAHDRPWRAILERYLDAARGLAAAHAAGLVHRDFKPDNVLVGDDGRVRVVDFGLALMGSGTEAEVPADDEPDRILLGDDATTRATAERITRTGALMGTPAYMAPEQFSNNVVDARSDQFAFCVALHEALFGERPFAGDSVPELYQAAAAGQLREPARGYGVPAPVRRVIGRGLAPDPADRFASMSSLLDALGVIEARRRRWRRALFAAGLGLVIAGGWGVHRYDRARRVAACNEEGRVIEESWNDVAREVVRRGLVATDLDYAPAVAERVMPWLDRYAESWRVHAVEACMHGQVDQTWTGPTLDKARWCLEERRAGFDQLLERLTRANARVAHNAVVTAANLPSTVVCTNEPWLRSMPAPPDDQARARIEAIDEDALKARRLAKAGQHEQGLELARRAQADADALGWLPLRVRILRHLGSILSDQARYAEAEAVSVDAYMTAVRFDAWHLAAKSALALTYRVGIAQARHDAGTRWAQHAEVAIAKAGDPLGLLEAERLFGLGTIHYERGEYERARDLYEQTLSLRRGPLGNDHPRVAAALSNLANAYYRLNRNEQALQLHEQALDIRIRILGPEHPNVAANLTNLGSVVDDLGQHERAKQLYQRALGIVERARGPGHPDVAANLNNLAFQHLTLEEYAQARPLYERAIAIKDKALGPKHQSLFYSIYGLGRSLVALGEHASAIPVIERALALDAPQCTATAEAQLRLGLAQSLWDAPPGEGRNRQQARSNAERVRELTAEREGLEDLHEQATAWLAEHPEQSPADLR